MSPNSVERFGPVSVDPGGSRELLMHSPFTLSGRCDERPFGPGGTIDDAVLLFSSSSDYVGRVDFHGLSGNPAVLASSAAAGFTMDAEPFTALAADGSEIIGDVFVVSDVFGERKCWFGGYVIAGR